tara:strand:- start:2192 stop:4132 length:1941 start_codon:yes stop_codon:yes gene_type:complete
MVEKRIPLSQRRQLTLRELLELELQEKPNKTSVAKTIEYLDGIVDGVTGANVLDLTAEAIHESDGQVLGDVFSDGPIKDYDDANNPTSRARSSHIIQDLKPAFASLDFDIEAGAERYLRDDYAKFVGKSLRRSRKTILGYSPTIYQDLSKLLVSPELNNNSKTVLKMMLFGGYRPATMASWQIENYDPDTGVFIAEDKKDKKRGTKEAKKKLIILNAALKDTVNKAIGDRKSGPVFNFDVDLARTDLNSVVKNKIGPVKVFSPAAGEIASRPFTSYYLRNLNEDMLSDISDKVDANDIAALSGRRSVDEAGGYRSIQQIRKNLTSGMSTVIAKIAGYSGSFSTRDYAETYGIELDPRTLDTVITADILDDDVYTGALPDNYLNRLETINKGGIPSDADVSTATATREQIASEAEGAAADQQVKTTAKQVEAAQARIDAEDTLTEGAKVEGRLAVAKQQGKKEAQAEVNRENIRNSLGRLGGDDPPDPDTFFGTDEGTPETPELDGPPKGKGGKFLTSVVGALGAAAGFAADVAGPLGTAIAAREGMNLSDQMVALQKQTAQIYNRSTDFKSTGELSFKEQQRVNDLEKEMSDLESGIVDEVAFPGASYLFGMQKLSPETMGFTEDTDKSDTVSDQLGALGIPPQLQ